MASGIIFRAISGFYYVKHEDGIAECRARGKFRYEKSSPLVGDRVRFTVTEQGRGYLTDLLPRSNSFVRPPIANIDKMVIFASAAIPVTDPYLVDRMAALAWKNSCEPVICISKCDIDPARRLFDTYSAAGFKVARTSALTGEGLPYLTDMLAGSVCVFTGNSGVGKSSIINALDSGYSISVGEVSKKLGGGRHTTRHVELYELSCGAIIADTPGFSVFDTDYLAPKEELARLFPDITPYIDSCRFLDCAHIREPDCAVLEAVGNGKIGKTRYDSYARLYAKALCHKDWEMKEL